MSISFSAERRIENGNPVLYINGEKQAPLIYALSDIPISSPLTAQAQKNIKNFANQGINIVSTVVNLCKGWRKSGQFCADFVLGDLKSIIETNPNACIILRLYVNAPYWWMRDYPEELCIFGKGDVPYIDDGDYERLIAGDEENKMRVSLASEKWKNEAGKKLVELLDAIENSPYVRQVIGIQIAGGVYGEWHQWGFNFQPDYGNAFITYFRKYIKQKYGNDLALRKAWNNSNATIESVLPATPELRNCKDTNPYRNPKETQYIVDSLEALQDCAPTAIIHFAKLIKSAIKRKIIIGTFYGYYDEWPEAYVNGHLGVKKLFNSGLIDYFSGPFSYNKTCRSFSGVTAARGLLESERLNGVIWLTEMDNPPIGSSNFIGGDPEFRNENIASLRRNILEPFTRGMGAWFFDHRLVLETGYRTTIYEKNGWWDHPQLLKEVNTLRKICDFTNLKTFNPIADVLLVFDDISRYYSDAVDAIYKSNMGDLSEAIGKSGVAFDRIYFDDLQKADLKRYKCIVFVNVSYISEERRKFIKEKVDKNQIHIVWINANGYQDENGMGANLVSDITGIQVLETEICEPICFNNFFNKIEISPKEKYSLSFKVEDPYAQTLAVYKTETAVAAAKKVFENHTSWYFSYFPTDKAVLRTIFKCSNAHIYSENGESILVGNGLVVISVITDSDITVTLKNGKKINDTLPAMTTAVYNEETGERIDTNI